MKNLTLRYGLYGALVLLAVFVITQFVFGTSLPYRTMEVIGYLTIVLSLSFVFFGIRAYRDERSGGSITFGKALQVGIAITLLPSVAIGLYTIILFMLRGKEMMVYFLKNMPEAERRQVEANAELYSNPFFQGVIMFATVFLVGFIIAILSAMVLKRQAVPA